MKVAPVSGDLIVKGVMLLAGVAVAVWAVRKVSGVAGDAAGQAWGAVKDGAWALSPTNNENVIYQTANGAFWPDGSNSIGSWLYDVINPEPRPENTGTNHAFYVPPGWDVTPQGPNGPRYNNPSAYIAPVGAMSIYR
ncbi:hypothetical protein [Acidovorax sp. LjRoot194]|uniref:hypothetical protein n=1 Tax=Acidovorax sp. LjRoot194 TaxID=3342280 RepID=UPI003ECEDAB6